MEFASPRFANDPVLWEILNDHDTGTKKLGPESHEVESIKKVQQALWDLGWTKRMPNPYFDHDSFVIGIYGPITQRTVTTYKQRYHIHYPPSAPTGTIDYYAGPNTLERLDHHCVLLDAADAAILAKVPEVTAATFAVFDLPTGIYLDTRGGASRDKTGGGPVVDPVVIFYALDIGAHYVHAYFLSQYGQEDGPTGRLGFPGSDAYKDGEGTQRQDFEYGWIGLDEASGATTTNITAPAEIQVGPSVF